jgi:hypothetical protein
MREGEEFEFEIPADHGDLVTVDGYEGRFFMVIGYSLIRNCLPEEEYNEVVYEVLDAVTGEFLEADGEDVEFVTDAEHAAKYLDENPPQYEMPKPVIDTSDWAIDISKYFGGVTDVAKEERKPTARELSAQEADRRKAERKERGEQIDNLLDLRNWAAGMLEKTGNEEFGDRVFAIDAELKKLVETD